MRLKLLKSFLLRLRLLRQIFSNDIVHERMANYPTNPTKIGFTTQTYDLLVMGSCNTDSLLAGLDPNLLRADQLLWDSRRYTEIPEIHGFDKKYDAIYVQLTLRHILESIQRGERGALSWIDTDELENYKSEAQEIIKEICDRFRNQNSEQTLIFGGFFTPTLSLEGPLRSVNTLSPLNNFISELNISLNKWCDDNQAYFIDVNIVANWIGRRHVVDDTVNGMLHNSTIGDDIYGNLTTRFINSTGISAQYDAWPRNIEFGKVLAEKIIEVIKYNQKAQPIKLIILDIDETLWRGIHAEDDFQNLARTEGWPLGFIEALLIYKQKGGLLALCSKNEETKTLEAFESIWKPHISIGDFATYRINYEPKSVNIAEILSDTNILPQNVLFVDDNPREIENVRSSFPDMFFMNNEHYDWRRTILSHSNFFMNASTVESKNRTNLIQTKIRRDFLKTNMGSRDEWLKSLEMRSTAKRLIEHSGADFDRVFELLNKTNQFNLNGKKISIKSLQEYVDTSQVLYFTLQDRLADNGIIAVVLINKNVIESFVLSCRVFGLDFEYNLIYYICQHFNMSLDEIVFTYLATDRNLAAKKFLDTYASAKIDSTYVNFVFE